MKLAFCLYKYFPYGGLQRDFYRIAQECIRRGHVVDIYTSSWEGEKIPDTNLILIPAKGWQNHSKNLHFSRQLQGLLAHQSYDTVIGFNKLPGLDVYYAADTCFQAKARRQHGAWYRFMPRFKQLAAFEQAVFAPHLDTKILLLSEHQQDEFSAFYKTPSDRFHILPPVISHDRVLPPESATLRSTLRQQYRLSDQDFLLLMVGSGFKTKGLDRIVKGLAALPSALKNRTHLWVIGKDDSKKFARLAKSLGVATQISFLGGQDNVPDFLLAADLLLHPAYNENTGTVLLEALIYGLPVLTTDICGYAKYVRAAQAGVVLSSPFEQAQFNQTLQDMLLSSERPAWRNNAIQFTQQKDLYSMPERATDFIESLR